MLVLECMENYYDFYGQKALDRNLIACSPANSFIDIYRILSVIRSTLGCKLIGVSTNVTVIVAGFSY